MQIGFFSCVRLDCALWGNNICSHTSGDINEYQWAQGAVSCYIYKPTEPGNQYEKLCLMLTCVCADVSSEQPGPGEGLAAGRAHTGKSVWADVHLQGTQAGVLLRAVFAVEGRARGDFSGHRRLQRSVVGELVVGQRWETGVAVAAVHTVVEVLDDIWTGGIWGASTVLFLLATAAAGRGGRAAEVQGAQQWGGQGRGGDRGQRCWQGVHAAEERAGGVAGQGRAVVLRWKFSSWKTFWDKSWRHRGEEVRWAVT